MRHPSDSVDEAVQQLWREWPAPSRNGVTVGRELQGWLCCWASGDKRIHCSNQEVSDSLERKHSHLSTPLCQHKYLSLFATIMFLEPYWGLTSLPHLASATQAFLADLQFLLQISPRKAILIAVLLQTMQFSCLQESPHVEPIFYFTWNLHPALCRVSAGRRWMWVWADRCQGCVLSGLCRRLVQGLLHPNTASG